jgi:hypothetical protein
MQPPSDIFNPSHYDATRQSRGEPLLNAVDRDRGY